MKLSKRSIFDPDKLGPKAYLMDVYSDLKFQALRPTQIPRMLEIEAAFPHDPEIKDLMQKIRKHPKSFNERF